MRLGRVVAVLAAAWLATATLAPGASAGAGAGAGEVPPVAARITLAGQDAWTALGGDLNLHLRIDGAVSGLTVSVVAHRAVTSRTAFERIAGGGTLGSVLDQVVVPVDLLGIDATGNRALALGLEAPGTARDAARLGVRQAGVYPLEVELRDDQDRTLSRFVTYLVTVEAGALGPTPIEQPLGVAWIWPLVAGPAALPDGSLDPAVVASFKPTGRLGRQAAALGNDTDVPVTIVPGPETMQTWAAAARDDPSLASGAAAIRAALARDQVVAGPYVPVDLPSLLAAGLTSAVDTQLVQGDEALKRFFETRLDPRTALARPVDAAALARLRTANVDRAVVESSAVAPSASRARPARPFTIETVAGPLSAVAGDTGLESLLGGDDPPALRAQRLLAALSVVATEQPATARAVTIVNPDDFDPPAALIDAVLAGLRNHPLLHAMTVDSVFAQVPPETASNETAVTRTLVPYSAPAAPVSAARYDRAVNRLNEFRGIIDPGNAGVALAERALVSSVSSAWNAPGAEPRARAEIGVVDVTIGSFLAQIHVPNPSTITLTSRSGEIPLTFRNDTGQPVSVLLRLDSQKLFFPDGASRRVNLKPRSTTVRFAVESRTSGSFPLRLTVRSADGALPITNTNFRIRSTAVSTVGLVLMIGAAVFLALWWGLDFRRRRARAPAEPAG